MNQQLEVEDFLTFFLSSTHTRSQPWMIERAGLYFMEGLQSYKTWLFSDFRTLEEAEELLCLTVPGSWTCGSLISFQMNLFI